MWRDVRPGLRSLLRSPALVAVATMMLAVGVGATGAVFSLLDGIVLRPLPVERPRELVLFSDNPTELVFTGTQTGIWPLFSTPSFEHLRAAQQSFRDVAAFASGRERLPARIEGAPELFTARRVSGNW